MRAPILMAMCCLAKVAFAQTPVNKTYPVQVGQIIRFQLDYPELIKVSTWEKNEVSIQGTVSINAGENDEAFQLSSSIRGMHL